jgi:hypothetical protein
MAGDPDHSVGKAEDFRKAEKIPLELAPHYPSALGTEVHGQEGGHVSPPKTDLSGRDGRISLSNACFGSVFMLEVIRAIIR